MILPHSQRARAWAQRLLGAAALLSPLLLSTESLAETTVPIEMQVDLMRRVVRFERGFVARSGEQIKVLLCIHAGSATAERTAAQLAKSLENAKDIGGKPLRVAAHRFTTPAALKKAIGAEGAQIVYLAPGFESDLQSIATALEGVPAITISTDGDQVDHGAVLGFELVSARPKIALNLGQAKKQGLDFNSDLFRLARIVK